MIALAQVIELLLQYKYAILFPIALVEGPIISVLGGFLSSSHIMNVYIVFGVVLLGDLVADTIFYTLGRFGGKRFLNRYGKYLFIQNDQVEKLQQHFQKHTGKTLFVGKITQGLGFMVLFSAGLAQVPYKRFMMWNLASASLKSGVLVLVGYYYGYAYQKINDYLGYATYFFIGLAIVLVIIYYFLTRSMKRML